ncbi:MAG TPA: aldehyde dehydrogenase family protein [Tepidisphaeraceae bacterium]|jgi:acyl-CoA reductase-like NAD-dependent aldehyde dehydrogenase|nr:aldehyde dehydrogenase family protein [Tepidisphaeraceae bacterium]
MANGRAHRNGNNGHTATAAKSRIAQVAAPEASSRLAVLKTYKIFIGGKFPRTESGRFYLLNNPRTGQPIANMCLCTRKDFRESVVAARAAQGGWAGRSAYNRSQIIYRIAEMLEGRAVQFVAEMVQMGIPQSSAQAEVAASVDRLVYYAGWADKYQQVFSSVNPVASSHFNFSVLEPTGVVSVLAPQNSALIGMISTIIPAITGGNAVIALASRNLPLCAVTLSEVLATSDLPGGVVNILTGEPSELIEHFASHMDVNAIIYCGNDAAERSAVRTKSAVNVKRSICYDRTDWHGEDAQNPYFILDTQETKTTWHPIGV